MGCMYIYSGGDFGNPYMQIDVDKYPIWKTEGVIKWKSGQDRYYYLNAYYKGVEEGGDKMGGHVIAQYCSP
jgi:hypothetical protein